MNNKLGCASVKLRVQLEILRALSDCINFGWWVTMLGIMGDHPWEAGQQYLGMCFRIMSDHPCPSDGG